MLSPGHSPREAEAALFIEYARKCFADSLRRNEAPLSALLLTSHPGTSHPNKQQNTSAIMQAWLSGADCIAVYTDHGIRDGMSTVLDEASWAGIPVERRMLR